MKKISIVLMLAFAMFATSAWALDLQDAKAQGLVGEQLNGYLGAVKPSAEVNALVADINARRKAMYQEIAQRNGTSVLAVEKLAGQKAIEKTLPGQYIQSPSGSSWQVK